MAGNKNVQPSKQREPIQTTTGFCQRDLGCPCRFFLMSLYIHANGSKAGERIYEGFRTRQ